MTPEERRKYNAGYWLANKDSLLAKRKRYRESNAEAIRSYRSSESVKAARRKRYLERVDVERARRRAWARINRPDEVRRARMREAAIGRVDYDAILRAWDGKCHICRRAVCEGEAMHFDHIVPLAAGGSHSQENLWPAHAVCNLRKQAKLMS